MKLPRILFVLSAVLFACGDSPVGEEVPPQGEEPPGPALDPVPASCEGLSAQPVDSTWTIESGGIERNFLVHVPAIYDPTAPTPVVLNFHGFTSNAVQQQFLANMDGKADLEGFISVHPNGTGLQQSWNAGECCGDALSNEVDDVQFTRDMLAELERQLCVDQTRIYATGLSNGGFMSNRLGCDLSDRIAAIAPVAGQLVQQVCEATRPVPVAHFHGTLDTIVPYAGNPSMGFPSVEDSLAAWASRNGCGTAKQERFRAGDSLCEGYLDCPGGADVILCTIEGGGHTWPGGLPVPALGKTTTDLSATEFMWNFFEDHQLDFGP